MTQAQRDIRRKLRILRHAEQTGNVSKTCRYVGISREIFYRWKRSYERYGEESLINSKPCPENPQATKRPWIPGTCPINAWASGVTVNIEVVPPISGTPR